VVYIIGMNVQDIAAHVNLCYKMIVTARNDQYRIFLLSQPCFLAIYLVALVVMIRNIIYWRHLGVQEPKMVSYSNANEEQAMLIPYQHDRLLIVNRCNHG